MAYLKAVTAAVITGLGAAQVAYTSGNHITTSEWIGIAIATLVALGAVWAVPNKTSQPNPPPAP